MVNKLRAEKLGFTSKVDKIGSLALIIIPPKSKFKIAYSFYKK